ncbi:Lead, cadmium, zinc and mercury transporting ATPase [Desulfosporosinus sp. I2]|uniref:cation transporter n=1 Tax=Desulfosporosinus sp. I2 TaxID=1617025 RepID=UPI00061E4A6C|nr:cation transporter [Desulfosporosinus sp. I2]KJR44190.1 Lead, cadmium, zinc and mercury transporting ATPase [Desulfosporosinus sp. I2]
MSNNGKRELVLEGLECTNCAMKIEEKVNAIKGVSHASLNFATKVLVIETDQVEKLMNL